MPRHGDSLDRAEVLGIIDQLLAAGDVYRPEDDSDPSQDAATQPSSQILRRLLQAGWLEEDKRSDYRRTIYLEPAAQAILEAFRTIVSQNIASFTGKLRLVCDRLAELRFPHSRAELIWEQLRACLADARSGLRELRLIRKQVERYAQRQLKAGTIAEALDLIYNEFSQLITQRCYRELIHARLPERLREANDGLAELELDDITLQRLRDDFLRTDPNLDAGLAMAEIRRTIEDLSLTLGDIEPTADKVDSSASEFARRSRARIRYIQDVGSVRRQQIKTIFDYVRDHLGDVRLADLEDKLELPHCRVADKGLVGMASLARSRRPLDPGKRQPVIDALTDEDREQSLREMERNLRNALRLDRANKFVDRLDLKPGETVESNDLPLRTEDDILDIISCHVFAAAGGANYRLRTSRELTPTDPIVFDQKAGFDIERFAIEKK
jgi:hypothetical protein